MGQTVGWLAWEGQFSTGCSMSHTTHGCNSDPHVASQLVGCRSVFVTGCCLLARDISLSEKEIHTIKPDSLGLWESGLHCNNGGAFVSKRCLFSPPQAWKRICLASHIYLYSQEHSLALAQSHGPSGGGYSLAIQWRGSASAQSDNTKRQNKTWFLFCHQWVQHLAYEV